MFFNTLISDILMSPAPVVTGGNCRSVQVWTASVEPPSYSMFLSCPPQILEVKSPSKQNKQDKNKNIDYDKVHICFCMFPVIFGASCPPDTGPSTGPALLLVPVS